MVAVVMTDERDKRNISNFIPYAVKRHSHRRKSASFKLKPVCLPRSGCFIAPWSWSLSWWRIGHTKQKQIFAPYYNPILPLLYYVLFYVWLGQAAMSMLQGKIILSIKGSHDVYQEFILLLQTDSKLFLWLILIFEDALMLQIATSHFTVTLQ